MEPLYRQASASRRLLLDMQSVPALYAGSCYMRLSWRYKGPLITVRRSSDNDERDFYPRPLFLDTAALLSFVGAGNGLVKTCYDQSGSGNHFSQSTTADQGTIVSGGSLVTTTGGKPTMNFTGGDSLGRSDAFGLTGAPALTMAHVSSASSIAGYPHICSIGRHPSTATAQNIWVHLWNEISGNWSYLSTQSHGPNFILTSTSNIHAGYVCRIAASGRLDSATLRQNGANLAVQSVAGNGALTLSLPNESALWCGGRGAASVDLRYFSGHSSMLIIYNSVVAGSDLTNLETVQAAHL